MNSKTANSSVKEPIAYYVIVDCGDGSGRAVFFKTYDEAEKYDEWQLECYGVGSLSEGVCSLFEGEILNQFDPHA